MLIFTLAFNTWLTYYDKKGFKTTTIFYIHIFIVLYHITQKMKFDVFEQWELDFMKSKWCMGIVERWHSSSSV